ncbi:MAG: adenosylmethionine--8-amino-7-oxononanoate transaminase [Candidatus Melainabacteria bacterium]|nr:adenosylmethionine--8-amino-7-oxononanoate transaminase [Candidatus Melainabacteria bacterium]
MSISRLSSPVWRPFTQMKDAPPLPRAVRGEGETIILEDGRRIIDMVSSWWVNVHGHAHPDIARAIYEQASRLEHVIFSEFSHEPAELLCEELLRILPASLNHVFFSDNGSTAVEVALKMAYQYWWNIGRPRSRFLAFQGGYHGDTIGAMSMAGKSGFFAPFEDLLLTVDTISYPRLLGEDGDNTAIEELEARSILEIEEQAARHPHQYAAIIIEPLVQGAGGMRICRPEFLGKLSKLASELDILLVYDEVMTGFGRTGDWFACTRSATMPDLICLSKGITGGFLPLAVTCATDRIYDAFLSDDHEMTFYHGHSYTANPIACAAANASIKLMHQGGGAFRAMEESHRRLGARLAAEDRVRNFRVCGTISAFEVASQEPDSYFNKSGAQLKRKFLEAGILVRPLGNTIYFMPPYCTSHETLAFVYDRALDVIRNI